MPAAEEIESLKESIKQVIIATVNGKIDKIDGKLDLHIKKHEEDMIEVKGHIAEVKPYLEGVRGLKFIGDTWKWIVSVAVAVLAFRSFF